MSKVAVVTDGAKGLGFEIVKRLCEKYPGIIHFTSKDETEGKQALEKLAELGFSAKFTKLDITNESSVMFLLKKIRYTYSEGGIDLLVNNENVKYETPYGKPLKEIALESIETNYEATKNFTKEMFYIMRKGAEVINLSSNEGSYDNIPNEELRKMLTDPELSLPQLDLLVKQYKKSVEKDSVTEDGWNEDPYIMSKVFLEALSAIEQRYFDAVDRDVVVSCIKVDHRESKDGKENTVEEQAGMIVETALFTSDKFVEYVNQNTLK